MGNLYCGNNLEIMKGMESDSIDLIATDPPFNTGLDFGEYKDRWDSMNYFVDWLRERVVEMRRLLKPTGALYLHCDSNASHYIKVMLDEEFGMQNFVQDIIWWRKNKLPDRRVVWRKYHDNILCYKMGPDCVLQNVIFDTGEIVTRKKIKKINGKIAHLKDKVSYEKKIVLTTSMITDIADILPGSNKERVGYPTQKPIKLYERIITTATNEGDTILDPFCGSGTTLVAASNLARDYIGIDENQNAIDICKERLIGYTQCQKA